MVAAAAMAASSALPPARSAATPDWVASRWGVATMPRGARDSGQRGVMPGTPHPGTGRSRAPSPPRRGEGRGRGRRPSELRAAGGGAAGDALETGAVAHHRELAAVAARVALVALEPGHVGRGEELQAGRAGLGQIGRA